MKVVKLYRKPDQPEFFVFTKCDEQGILVNYPTGVPDRMRGARWFLFDEVYIDWIREFADD